ncbi:PREDICTED: probable E3 ubiquitin-protein ligase RNF217-like [Fragaria vesca subsp. vesca]|nr:PREDICTED: E3 ubiquitin-protein ligase RNF144B-like isoform X2 [Fragaria vesca subsp. vesca]XP_011469426.1 PREDICTED: E3 ubiquitin-protein ligase RNF144B-like isoform X2 [Fragaria vesca subsp. vesca]XP_011469427.1 PREDICTED: E3 ubiquitin-protein ligase RNF144B-like isoform X2 [Fragaria vesca subsp. vesca]
MEHNRSGIQEQTNTFWTQCPFCCTKLQYYRDILGCLLNCHICRKAFEAHELKKDVHSESLKSAPSPITKAGNFIDLSAETLNYYDSDEEVRVLRFKPSNIPFGKRKRNEGSISKPPSFACEICLETKSAHESFGIKNCTHVYCTDCVVKYVDSKLEQNIASIGCLVPDCNKGSLDPEHCRLILKPEVFEKWGKWLCEDVITGSLKFYCPFKDCSTMLIDDGEEVVRESECPSCKRLFCAQCKVPWHTGITCEEFKKLNKDDTAKEDIKMERLAYKKHWRKCPRCGIYVERTGGCSTVHCRCGTYFSFHCGRWGCASCRNRKRGSKTLGFYMFFEEYRRIHRSYSKDTLELVNEKWRSMSRSEKNPMRTHR